MDYSHWNRQCILVIFILALACVGAHLSSTLYTFLFEKGFVLLVALAALLQLFLRKAPEPPKPKQNPFFRDDDQ